MVLGLLVWRMTEGACQLLPSYGNSRTATSGAAALKLPLDAYSAAMAGSVVAPIHSAGAAYWNPGALPSLDSVRWALQADYLRYAAGVEGAAATVVYSRSYLKYWAFRWASVGTDYMEVTNEFHPLGTGDRFSYQAFMPSISYGMVLTRHFNFGITGRLFHEQFYRVRNLAFLVDLGFTYDLRLRRLTKLGVAASNFGFLMRPQVRLPGDSTARAERLIPPAVFRLGVVREVWRTSLHRVIISAQLNHPTDNNETIAAAVEYAYDGRFFVRTGYEWGTDQRRFPSLGAGFRWPWRWGGLALDYALRSLGTLGWTHTFSIATFIQ